MRIFIIALIAFFSACNKNTGESKMTPSTIKIKLGEQGSQFLDRNNLPAKNHTKKQPAGLNFYEFNWRSDECGTIFFEHGKYSFQIPFTLSVMGSVDSDHLENGIEQINVYSGMSATSTISHDEARREFIGVLQKLLALGWNPVISYDDPRLTGEEAFKYYQEDDNYGVPLNYNPTLEEWMAIEFGFWHLYADDAFLSIYFRRGVESKDPNKAAYLFNFEFRTKEEKAKAQFEGKDRDRWQELWVDKIKSMKKKRYEKEKELIQRGFTIYTEYEEPIIHPLDPVEP